jgi:hypothetical protein
MNKWSRELKVFLKIALIILEKYSARKGKAQKRDSIYVWERSEELNLSGMFFHYLSYDARMDVPFFF